MLGANGSGKSNLVSFFSMLNYMTTGAFQQFVGKYGVNRLLYYCSKRTESISFELTFRSKDIKDTYYVKLSHGLPDRLFISGEKVTFHRVDAAQPLEYFVPTENYETGLGTYDHETSEILFRLLEDYIRLNWTDNSGNDYLFDPHQISDGSLRFIALVTLLLQPPDLLPRFIVLDEPELGLHPLAIAELAGIVRAASLKTQVLLATQSTRLIDEFLPKDIVVVERDEKEECSLFKKLDPEQLKDWIDRL